MRKLSILLSFFFFYVVAEAQKTIYDPNAEVRQVSGYHSIQVSSGIDVHLTYGDEVVVVSASEEKYRDRIKTEVVNGVLRIWYQANDHNNIVIGGRKELKAYVSYKTLKSIDASGGSDVIAEDEIKADALIVDISGGSDFKGAIRVAKLKVDQSGGSDVTVSGFAEKVEIDASGGSDFKGFGLSADYCEASASGGSDVEITVNKSLSAKASGASDITYKGNPEVTESKSSGASSVNKRS